MSTERAGEGIELALEKEFQDGSSVLLCLAGFERRVVANAVFCASDVDGFEASLKEHVVENEPSCATVAV